MVKYDGAREERVLPPTLLSPYYFEVDAWRSTFTDASPLADEAMR